ncbi:MAG: GNAT family N-acetyltransferase [Anaeroplasma sp.]
MKTVLPVLKIGSITLREVLPEDYLDYYEIGKDNEVVRYLNWGPYNNPMEALWIIKEVFYKRPLDGLPIGYAIVIDNKMIGIIDYHTYDFSQNACEIGYVLNRNYWGLGIMKKCLKAVIDVGFSFLDLDKLICGHLADNTRSRNVILACGFHYERQVIVNNKGKDELGIYYSLYKYEYQGR